MIEIPPLEYNLNLLFLSAIAILFIVGMWKKNLLFDPEQDDRKLSAIFLILAIASWGGFSFLASISNDNEVLSNARIVTSTINNLFFLASLVHFTGSKTILQKKDIRIWIYLGIILLTIAIFSLTLLLPDSYKARPEVLFAITTIFFLALTFLDILKNYDRIWQILFLFVIGILVILQLREIVDFHIPLLNKLRWPLSFSIKLIIITMFIIVQYVWLYGRQYLNVSSPEVSVAEPETMLIIPEVKEAFQSTGSEVVPEAKEDIQLNESELESKNIKKTLSEISNSEEGWHQSSIEFTDQVKKGHTIIKLVQDGLLKKINPARGERDLLLEFAIAYLKWKCHEGSDGFVLITGDDRKSKFKRMKRDLGNSFTEKFFEYGDGSNWRLTELEIKGAQNIALIDSDKCNELNDLLSKFSKL